MSIYAAPSLQLKTAIEETLPVESQRKRGEDDEVGKEGEFLSPGQMG
jgi:hypothetical protein